MAHQNPVTVAQVKEPGTVFHVKTYQCYLFISMGSIGALRPWGVELVRWDLFRPHEVNKEMHIADESCAESYPIDEVFR